jgi:hypothetical protein
VADKIGPPAAEAPARGRPTFAWWLVLCLVGLDYFSTLAYLPSIAVEADGRLAPLAALGVVLVTLLVALPVYSYVVGRSPDGAGATGLLEKHLHGWGGKLALLVLLGFVATDFIMTRTVSVADAAQHLTHNPYWHSHVEWATRHKETLRQALPEVLRGSFFELWTEQVVITILLSVAGFGFYFFIMRGFTRRFMLFAATVVLLFLVVNGIVAGSAVAYLVHHPGEWTNWMDTVRRGTHGERTVDLLVFISISALFWFPQVALGLSGFELSMTSVPLVRGWPADRPEHPRGRIRNTRKLLLAAGVVMSALVLTAVTAATLLVPADAFGAAGSARYRALAYLAHGGPLANGAEPAEVSPLFGPAFGTLYDLSTILILCLAGASVTITLREVVPRYLARYGMQVRWASRVNVVLHLFNLSILVVIVYFQASVSAQQWAYAGSVLVLLTTAALAAALDLRARWRGHRRLSVVTIPAIVACLLFTALAIVILAQHADAAAIALTIVGVLIVTAFVSRWLRSMELRFRGFAFADPGSKTRWEAICRMQFQVLVPHQPGHLSLADKELQIRKRHRLGPDVPIVFVEAEVSDPSEFYNQPILRVQQQDGHDVVRVTSCASVAHALAAVALECRHVGEPPEVHFAWSSEGPLAATLHFLIFGEGNIPLLVHSLVERAESDPARRPRVVVG